MALSGYWVPSGYWELLPYLEFLGAKFGAESRYVDVSNNQQVSAFENNLLRKHFLSLIVYRSNLK